MEKKIPGLFEICYDVICLNECKHEIHNMIYEKFGHIPNKILNSKYEIIKSKLPFLKEILNKNTMYLFYTPYCAHSFQMLDKWNELKEKLKYDNIELVPIDSFLANNYELVRDFNIISTPTIIVVTNENHYRYYGYKKTDEIIKYVRKKIYKNI
jgi:thiol-disulfide isomerase/thioredoxin